MRAWLERLAAPTSPPRCPGCRVEMTLEHDVEVCSLPPVFEARWMCVVCGETAHRCRVFEAIH